jgi:hypothetical protein
MSNIYWVLNLFWEKTIYIADLVSLLPAEEALPKGYTVCRSATDELIIDNI